MIGNGPSLKMMDLDLLKPEVTFATNRIYRAYKDGGWRPTYYVRMESTHENRVADAHDLTQIRHPCTMYLHKGLKRVVPWDLLDPTTKVEFFHTCQHGWPYHDDKEAPDWHLDKGIHSICNFGTSVHAAMQIAVVLGYDPIYLLGCDLGFIQGGENHFVPGYSDGFILRPAEDVNRDAYSAHKAAARCSPVPIYNATKGGYLDMYPRVRMEDVLYL